MNFKKIEEINEEINIKSKELVELIKQYNPYDIICNVFIFIRDMQSLIDDNNTLSEYDKMETQFCVEFLYGLITCVNIKEFKNNFFEEIIIYEIMNKCKELFELKQHAMTSIMLHKNINNGNQDYIFDDLIRLDITGKRYDVFEKEHHRNALRTVFKYITEKYSISEHCLLDGIEHLKTDAIFGLNKAIKKIEKIMNDNSIEDINSISEELKKETLDAINEMFGLENFDVLKITNWPIKFIDVFSTGVGKETINLDSFDFLQVIKIQNIINQKPIISIDNKYYCIRLPRLLDNFDKILLKQLYKDYEEKKQEIIKSFSQNIENYTKEIFSKIFGKNAKYYQNNFYKKNGKSIENDLLIQLDDFLFIVEIKSGNFTPDLAYENIESHIDTLNNLVSKAGTQISELEKELLENKILKIYDSNKKGAKLKAVLNKNQFKNIFKIAITFEGFNEIAARAEKFGIINLNKNIIVCSIDDLEVYGDYFKNQPINFINYIINRTVATQNKLINLNDELDHLGLYLVHSNYSMYIDSIAKEYKNIGMVGIFEYRTDIDNYYNGKYYNNETKKPKLNYPIHINNIIDFLNNHNIKNNIIVGNSLISCDSNNLEKFESYIEEMIDFFKIKNKCKYMAIGIDNYLFIVSCCINSLNNEQQLIRDCYANLKLSNANEAYAAFIIYDKEQNILDIKTIHLTKNDYQYHNDLEIEIIASYLKSKRENFELPKRKVGRNEPCPCGSGRKYKMCHGK
jgi:hypothetical protein